MWNIRKRNTNEISNTAAVIYIYKDKVCEPFLVFLS